MADDNVFDAGEKRKALLLESVQRLLGPNNTGSALVVDGVIVPDIAIHDRGDDGVTLTLDRRYLIDLPLEYAGTVTWFLANAMAVAAGYPCIGGEKIDRYGSRCNQLSELPK